MGWRGWDRAAPVAIRPARLVRGQVVLAEVWAGWAVEVAGGVARPQASVVAEG